jgi:hypothetical protein
LDSFQAFSVKRRSQTRSQAPSLQLQLRQGLQKSLFLGIVLITVLVDLAPESRKTADFRRVKMANCSRKLQIRKGLEWQNDSGRKMPFCEQIK